MKDMLRFGLAAAAAMFCTFSGAMSSIDTTPSWNGTNSASYFGEPDSATYGQTISTDATGGVLTSFTFYLSPLNLDFKAFVYQWDGAKAVGPALYSSAVTNIGDSFTGFRATSFNTGGVSLAANTAYVLFFSTSGVQAQRFNTNTWGALSTDAYAGGEFVFHNSSNDPSSLLAAAGWDCPSGCDYLGRGADLAFKASIAPALVAVPEPSALVLALAGLGLVGAAVRRRTKV